ncbi:DUF2793 domain-containing protein [Roseovarius sp.]|uniref:DUF2793 domain-containing protein n=1 Tax=Roseovarius sp. TaxID=1486281 RepID=UPI003A96E7B2
MSDLSARLDLPFIAPSQAQKHVTHNEAVQRLDLLVQMALDGFEATEPPAVPETGARYALGPGATGVWAGQDGQLAMFADAAWTFVTPQEGWIAAERGGSGVRIYRQGVWRGFPDRLEALGIGTQADAANPLNVAAEATLLSHAGAGHQLKINKAAVSDTASLLFQTAFAGHAEMGLAGQDDFSIKVSADGADWTEALRVDAQTGQISGAAVQSHVADATAGRVLTVGAAGAALGSDVFWRGNILGPVGLTGGVPTGALIESVFVGGAGEYSRFANGLQICATSLATSSAGEVTWTYPAAFAATPRVAAVTIGGGAISIPRAIGGTTTSVSVSSFNTASARVSSFVGLIVIGRWA